MKGKKLKKTIKLYGQYYMQPDGTIYYYYGGWTKLKFAKIPTSSNAYKKVVETYGTKQGERARMILLKVLLKHGKWKIKK